MNETPYAAPASELEARTRSAFPWRTAALAASASFVSVPALVVLMTLVSGQAFPAFIFDPGFLATLAAVSTASSSVLAWSRLETWLHCLLAVVATSVLMVGLVIALASVAVD